MKLLGLGDNVMDAYLFRGELYPGGNAANVSVLAKRAGAEATGYLGLLADDPAGRHFLAALEAEGVDTARVRRAVGKTACNHITLDENGDRCFSGSNGQETVQSLLLPVITAADRDYAARFDVVHSSIHSGLTDAMPALSRRTELSVDFSGDGYTHVNVAQLAPFLRFSFFSSCGRPAEDMWGFLEFAAAQRISEVVCTLGLHGSCGISRGRRWSVPACPVKAVDALGAGDAYAAAFLVAFYDNGGQAEDAASTASRFAADACLHYGAFGHPLPLEQSGLF